MTKKFLLVLSFLLLFSSAAHADVYVLSNGAMQAYFPKPHEVLKLDAQYERVTKVVHQHVDDFKPLSMAEAVSHEVLTARALYEAFNLRSISSSLAQSLKWKCKRTMADFYEPNVAIFSDNQLQIEAEDWYYNFQIMSSQPPYKVKFTDDAKQGTYLSSSVYTLDYSPEINQWFAIAELEGDEGVRSIAQDSWIGWPGECD